jgi:transcriptional regulator with XRE-family HTH domain
MIGISQPSLSLIENDKTAVPAGDTLAALCKALQTTPDFIMAGTGDADSIASMVQEHELVYLYRDLPEAGRQMVLDAARSAQRALSAADKK